MLSGRRRPPPLQHHLGGGDGASLGAGVGADDDAVAGLQGDQGLKMAVEVGLVVGMTAAITPMGSATFLTPKAGSSSTTPQVLVFLYLL